MFSMKLAEALRIKSEYDNTLSSLSSRLWANAVVQEGDEPAEKPSDLKSIYFRTVKKKAELLSVITQVNSSVEFDFPSWEENVQRCVEAQDEDFEVQTIAVSMMQAVLDVETLREFLRVYRQKVERLQMSNKQEKVTRGVVERLETLEFQMGNSIEKNNWNIEVEFTE